jgi:hypothetical protein
MRAAGCAAHRLGALPLGAFRLGALRPRIPCLPGGVGCGCGARVAGDRGPATGSEVSMFIRQIVTAADTGAKSH